MVATIAVIGQYQRSYYLIFELREFRPYLYGEELARVPETTLPRDNFNERLDKSLAIRGLFGDEYEPSRPGWGGGGKVFKW